jgi:hypothetical protein
MREERSGCTSFRQDRKEKKRENKRKEERLVERVVFRFQLTVLKSWEANGLCLWKGRLFVKMSAMFELP